MEKIHYSYDMSISFGHLLYNSKTSLLHLLHKANTTQRHHDTTQIQLKYDIFTIFLQHFYIIFTTTIHQFYKYFIILPFSILPYTRISTECCLLPSIFYFSLLTVLPIVLAAQREITPNATS